MHFKGKSTPNSLNGQPLQAISLIRRMIGGSGPSLVEASDGALYIVKTWGNRRHPNALANEFLGSALCAAAGLPVPSSRPIHLSKTFLETFDLSVQYEGYTHHPEPGVHYASRMVEPSDDRAFLIEHLSRNLVKFVENRDDFVGMYLLDLCVNHCKPRQAIFIKSNSEPASRAIFINHDQMFGGSNWNLEAALGYPSHQLSALYHGLVIQKDVSSWLRKLGARMPFAVDAAVKNLPSEWYTGSLTSLQAWLHPRIQSLPRLLDHEIARASIFREHVNATMLLQSPRICQIRT